MAGLLHMIMAQWSEPNFLESSVIPRLLCVLALAAYERSLGRILFFMGFPSSCIMEFIKIVFFFFFLLKMQTQKIREDYWGKKKKISVSFPNPLPSTFNSVVRFQLLINFSTPTLVLNFLISLFYD